MVKEMASQDSASAAALQGLARNLRSTRTAITGRFGRTALKPVYELLAKEGEAAPRSVQDCIWWLALVPPSVAPRLVSSLRHEEPAGPVRIFSGFTGAGKLVIISCFSRDGEHLLSLLVAQAYQKPQGLAATSHEMYIFELFAAVGSVSQLRGRFWGRRKLIFVDNAASGAAFAEGISKNKAALMLVCLLWAIAAHYDIAIWAGGVPTQVNPSDLLSRDGKFSFAAAPHEDLATLGELFSICDRSSALFQHGN